MKINVAYSCDDSYIPHTGISILSLLENNKDADEVSIYFIERSVSKNAINLLTDLIKSYGRQLIVISFWDLCRDLKINTLGRHIETVYAKLFFSGIKGVDKILYIDSDTIINESLSDFWSIDLTNYLVGGVSTHTVGSKLELGLNEKDIFINDGVVLINLKEFREQNIENQFVNCISSYNGTPPVLSEGVINKVCKGQIKVIHPKYNLMSGLITYKHNPFLNLNGFYKKEIIKEAISKPVIIHYLSGFYNRPWDINCTHPLKNHYLKYKSLSLWKNDPLQNKKLSLRIRFISVLYKIIPSLILNFFRYLFNKKS